MTVNVNIVNAFTQDGRGGNAAAVVLDADNLSPADKQLIAGRTGLSETAFVSRSLTADFKLDFFTPVRQISHCGHATIATFAYLRQGGKIDHPEISSKETIDGNRAIRFFGNEVFMQQSAPVFSELEAGDIAIAAASLHMTGFTEQRQPLLVNTGNTFLVLEVDDEATLQAIRPDFKLINEISEKYGLIGYYIYCKATVPGIDVTTRMFAPAYGIEEESATGMAAGPLACYLFSYREAKTSYAIEQGRFMQPASASLIHVNLVVENDKLVTLFAGGTATLMKQQTIEI